jgi:hypothetical protein
MSNDLGNTASWLAGVAAGAAVVCWAVIPAITGLGTQRSPANGDLAKPGDVFQWLGANIARVSGDFAVTFEKDRINGAPVAGSRGLPIDPRNPAYLPQSYTRQDLRPPATQSSVLGGSQACAGSQDLNCDGLVSLDEMEPK